MEMLTGCFGNMNNERLLKNGITSPMFNILEDVNLDKFNELKVGDEIKFIFNNKEYKGKVAYKYRDKKDIKIEFIGEL